MQVHALKNLARNSPKRSLQIVQQGGVGTIFSALQIFENNHSRQEGCLSALAGLCLCAGVVSHLAAEEEIIVLILRVM